MSTRFIVALHALPRAGKTTVAEELVRRGFQRFGFGDRVYVEVAEVFGVEVEQLRSHSWKTEPQPVLQNKRARDYDYRELLVRMGQDQDASRTSRYHLQRYATEYRRAQNQMYWVQELDKSMHNLRGDIVIDDLRFVDSEYPYLRHLASITGRELRVIEILRPGYAQPASSHASDKRLPFHLIDHVMENHEGMPDVLQAEVMGYLYPSGD